MSETTEPDGTPLDPASRRVGSVLDEKWTLVRLLGVGGMAAVYAATHRNGARAAIKLFPFSVTTSAEFAERILREGYLANKIGHPAVVRVLDDHLDRDRDYAYLVMELLEGETARQRVERTGPMTPLEAVGCLLELTDCLEAAHEKGVVHRDIKPENLFLTTEGKLKVLDFGVARALDGTSSSVTRTGAMLGTPAYMSPEQARGKPSEISPRSDLYSVGATLLFLLTGVFVHEGESAQEIMVRAAWTPARKVRERGLGIPDVLADVIDTACAFDPKDRYASAADMRRALVAASAALAGNPTASRPLARVASLVPASTIPIALRRPRDGSETIADRTPDPPDATSVPGLPVSSKRRVIVLAAAAVLTLAAVALAFRPRAREAMPSPPVTHPPVSTPTSQVAPPEPRPARDDVNVPPGAVSASAPAPARPEPAPSPPRRTEARDHAPSHAAPRPARSAAPTLGAPVHETTRSAAALPPVNTTVRSPAGRDIGY